MRTRLPENRQTTPKAGLKRRDSLRERRPPPEKAIQPQLGVAEAVDQTFLCSKLAN